MIDNRRWVNENCYSCLTSSTKHGEEQAQIPSLPLPSECVGVPNTVARQLGDDRKTHAWMDQHEFYMASIR